MLTAYLTAVGVAITYAFYAHTWGWYEGGLTLLPYARGDLFFGVFGDAMGRAETTRQKSECSLAELRRTVATLRQPLASDLPLPQALTGLTTSFTEATGSDV